MAQGALASDKKGAQKQRAALVFLDESGFSQRPSIRRTWAPRGDTPVLRLPFNWKRLSAMGALATTPGGRKVRLFLSLLEGSVASERVIRFLGNLRRHLPGKAILLWDRLPAHRSKRTGQFLETQSHWLRAEFLPAYAPELNPIEYVWAYLSDTDLANYSADTMGDLTHQVGKGVRRLRRKHEHGRAFLKESGLF